MGTAMTYLERTGLWRCECGYINLSPTCDRCQPAGAAARPATGAPLDPTGDEATRAATATTASRRAAGVPLSSQQMGALLTVGLVIIGNVLYQLGVVRLVAGQRFDVTLTVVCLTGLLFYLLVGWLATARARSLSIHPTRAVGSVREAAIHGLLVGVIAAGIGAIIALTVSSQPVLDPFAVLIINSGSGITLVLGMLAVVVLAPVVEEYVFRGVLAEAYRSKGVRSAVLVSAGAFAIAHLSVPKAVYFFAMGSLLTRVYLRRGLVASTMTHFAINATVFGVALAVLTTGPGAVGHAAGLRVPFPRGWQMAKAPANEDLAALGPAGAVIELAHVTTSGGLLDVSTLAQRLRVTPLRDQMSVDAATVNIRTDLPLGAAVEADATMAGQRGRVVFVIDGSQLDIVAAHAPDGLDSSASGDLETVLHLMRHE